jgi:hypothetical protein
MTLQFIFNILIFTYLMLSTSSTVFQYFYIDKTNEELKKIRNLMLLVSVINIILLGINIYLFF